MRGGYFQKKIKTTRSQILTVICKMINLVQVAIFYSVIVYNNISKPNNTFTLFSAIYDEPE